MDLHQEMGALIEKYIGTIDTSKEGASAEAQATIITEALLLAASFAIGTKVTPMHLAATVVKLYEVQMEAAIEKFGGFDQANADAPTTVQ